MLYRKRAVEPRWMLIWKQVELNGDKEFCLGDFAL